MDMATISSRIVGMLKARGADVDQFRADVLDLAHETARSIATTLDEGMTSQLKAALQFLYGLADGTDTAPDARKGLAGPGGDEGFPEDAV